MAHSTECHVATPIRRRRFSLLRYALHLADVARQRRTLRNLDDKALKDVGLTRRDVDREARRGFWDVPDFWRN